MKRLILAIALAGVAFAQSYPSAIYTAPVARDNVATTLSAPMAAIDTVAVVTSGTGFVANMYIYVCDGAQTGTAGKCTGTFEIMKVTNVAGNVLTVTRAQGGTSAVAHASGKAISNAVTSPYVNGPSNEVAAVEAALGTNLSNVLIEVSADRYNFTPQAPGGTLTASVGATVTLTPCPLGVAGANIGQYLLVSNGTGTTEGVAITGGTCTSGAGTGTVTFTPAFNHSGAWTVGSATVGGQEAHNAAPAGSTIVFTPGGKDFYGPMFVTKGGTHIRGSNAGFATNLVQHALGLGIIVNTLNGWGATVDHLTLTYASAATAGTVALTFQGTMAGDIFWPSADRVQCYNVATCISFADAQYFSVKNAFSQGYSEYGVRSGKVYGSVDGGDSRIQDCTFGGGLASIFLDHTPVVIMTGNKFNGGGYGILSVNSGGPVITNSSFENHTTAGILIQGDGGTDLVLGGLIANNFIDQNFDVAWGGIILAPYGALAIRNIQIKGNLIGGLPARTHTQTGVFFGGSSTATDVSIEGDFAALTNAVNVSAGNTNISVTNYSLGTVADAVTVPFVLSNTETTIRPNAPVTYAELVAIGAARDGSRALCSDCNALCTAGSGTGQDCKRINGVWVGLPNTYIATEGGANNAITGTLANVPLVAGLSVTIKLAHTLQAGANTFAYNGGGALGIKSSRNVANDIGTAYASTGVVTLVYDGTRWLDASQ